MRPCRRLLPSLPTRRTGHWLNTSACWRPCCFKACTHGLVGHSFGHALQLGQGATGGNQLLDAGFTGRQGLLAEEAGTAGVRVVSWRLKEAGARTTYRGIWQVQDQVLQPLPAIALDGTLFLVSAKPESVDARIFKNRCDFL